MVEKEAERYLGALITKGLLCFVKELAFNYVSSERPWKAVSKEQLCCMSCLCIPAAFPVFVHCLYSMSTVMKVNTFLKKTSNHQQVQIHYLTLPQLNCWLLVSINLTWKRKADVSMCLFLKRCCHMITNLNKFCNKWWTWQERKKQD